MKKSYQERQAQSRLATIEQSAHGPVLKNAARLLEDARILRKSRRYPSATALAILSLEEVGKFRTLDEDFIFWNSRIHKRAMSPRKHLYTHKSKQKAAAEALIDGMGVDEVRELARVAGYEVVLSKGHTSAGASPVDVIASIDKETFRDKVAAKVRRSKHHGFVIELAKGEFDAIKQRSIYVDEQDGGKLSQPTATIDRVIADRAISLASGAIYVTQMTLRYARAVRKSSRARS
jgi:AbiV family abortive infection protein